MKFLKITLIIVFLLVLGGYGIFQGYDLIRGPILVVTSPLSGSLFNEPVITISGYTKNISYIYLNDYQIYVDEEGYFNQKLVLNEGYNIMTLRVKDRFERETKEELHYILKEEDSDNDSLDLLY
tara:strand:- start:153 stop:524 length:372 start_codon:yes stop_codon:yes gene_type:complete